MKQFYVYILKCLDNSYYTGVTNNLERRLVEHQEGINKECYTYKRRPVELVFYNNFNDINAAISFEKQIKGWSRKKKEAIINNYWEDLKKLSECKNVTSHKNYKNNNNTALSQDEIKTKDFNITLKGANNETTGCNVTLSKDENKFKNCNVTLSEVEEDITNKI